MEMSVSESDPDSVLVQTTADYEQAMGLLKS